MHITKYGSVTPKSRLLTMDIMCGHPEKYWYGIVKIADLRHVQLYSNHVIGLIMHMRFDEISKFYMEHISTTPVGALLTSIGSIKNSTIQKNYRLREWEVITLL